jgi:hypothetical protein
LKTYYGNTKIIFGSNVFIGCPNILVVDNEPIFTATVKDRKLIISIVIYDRENKIVAHIENNKWIINKKNYLKMDVTPSKIIVTNQYGEVALNCTSLYDGSVKVNGTFYINGIKFVATNQGLSIETQ